MQTSFISKTTSVIAPDHCNNVQEENNDLQSPENLIPKNRGFKIACLNITSLHKHIDELRICLNDREVDILAINETRLDSDFPKELISIYGYNWIGRDRNRHGGGIGFYIRDMLNYRVRSDLNNTDIEVLTIEISKYKTKPFLITTWYRPPNTPIEKFQEFEKPLQYIDLEDKESIILGDLNCDLISKDTNDCNSNELNFITNMYQYKQLIQEPTRVTRNTKSFIDHFFTNKPESIALTGVSKTTISDHYLIYGIRKFPSVKVNTQIIEFRDFKNLNERAFLDDIRSLGTLNLHQYASANEMWLVWKEHYAKICDKHAPIKRRKIRNKSNPWITDLLLHEKRHKNYLKRKACKTSHLNDWENYKYARNNYNKLIKNTIKRHFSNDIQNNKENLKKTWKSINQCLNRNHKSKKIVLIKDANRKDIKSEDMANAFNEHFINIGSNLAQQISQPNHPPEFFINRVDKVFTFREIFEEEVLTLLLNMSTNKATGMDRLSIKLVKLSAPLITHAMTVIFNKSIVSGTFPCEWKISKVTPVYKTGPREDMNNYRPIYVISIVAKTMEKLVYNQLYEYFTKNDMLTTSQHGFRPNHSTVTAMLEIANKWFHNIDIGQLNIRLISIS